MSHTPRFYSAKVPYVLLGSGDSKVVPCGLLRCIQVHCHVIQCDICCNREIRMERCGRLEEDIYPPWGSGRTLQIKQH